MKLRILSYNIHKGFSLFNKQFTLPKIREFLRELQPDIVLLQEVVGLNSKHQLSIPEWPQTSQSDFLGEQHWPHTVYGKNAIFQEGRHHRHHGNAILSKYPILHSTNEDISNNRWERRGLLHAQIQIPGQSPVHIFNVHLDLTQQGRNNQLQKIIDQGLARIPLQHPLILAGDFNDWRKKARKNLEAGLHLKEAFHEQDQNHALTFPSFRPTLSLDRVFFRGLKLSSAQRILTSHVIPLSDHVPLLVELEVPE